MANYVESPPAPKTSFTLLNFLPLCFALGRRYFLFILRNNFYCRHSGRLCLSPEIIKNKIDTTTLREAKYKTLHIKHQDYINFLDTKHHKLPKMSLVATNVLWMISCKNRSMQKTAKNTNHVTFPFPEHQPYGGCMMPS